MSGDDFFRSSSSGLTPGSRYKLQNQSVSRAGDLDEFRPAMKIAWFWILGSSPRMTKVRGRGNASRVPRRLLSPCGRGCQFQHLGISQGLEIAGEGIVVDFDSPPLTNKI